MPGGSTFLALITAHLTSKTDPRDENVEVEMEVEEVEEAEAASVKAAEEAEDETQMPRPCLHPQPSL